jgi:hypothetical protein
MFYDVGLILLATYTEAAYAYSYHGREIGINEEGKQHIMNRAGVGFVFEGGAKCSFADNIV